MKFWKLICLVMALMLALVPISAQDVEQELPYDNPGSPVDLLASYYNAINLQDYQRAYSYRESISQSYEAFARGFADTLNVQLIVQPPTRIEGAVGSAYADIPSVLIATHRDGTLHTYAGCFVTRKINPQTPDMPDNLWHIYSAKVSLVSNTASIPTLLKQACEVQ